MINKICVAAVIVAPTVACAQGRYMVEDLGRLTGAHSSVATAISQDGTIIGWGQGPMTTVRGFIARPGLAMQELPMPGGFGWSLPTDISDDGRYIVGYAQVDFSTAPRPWRWRDGIYEMLPVPAGYSGARPTAVNSEGVVVGNFANVSFSNSDDFVWDAATGYLDPTPGQIAAAEDINDVGEVVGGGMAGFPLFPAYKWTMGGGLQLFNPLPNDDYARVNGVSSNGKMTGGSFFEVPGRDRSRAVVAEPAGPLAQVGTSQIAVVEGFDINASGTAIGMMGTSSTPRQTAWIYSPAQGFEILDPLVQDTENIEVGDVADINDAGMIAASGYYYPTFPVQPSALRLIPVGGGICYANCDSSTQSPVLNVADFGCFLQRFAAADPYANCDQSTQEPILNVADFGCFLQAFSAGCP